MRFRDAPDGHRAKRAKGCSEGLSHVLHVPYPRDSEKSHLEGEGGTGTRKPWLDALKETIEEEPRSPREDSGKPGATTVQNVQKPRAEAGGEVVYLEAARPPSRGQDERRLLAAGWTPKDGCGPLALTIWADPETGFYCSREIALHRLETPLPVSPYRKLLGGKA